MLYGLYLSAQGAAAQSTRLDVIANNLANASTHGFKRDLAVFMAHRPHDLEYGAAGDPPGNLNDSTGGVSPAGVLTDFSTGPIVPTGGTWDVALAGEGFLRVSDGQQEFLTRDGRLTVNAQGELVTGEHGHRLLAARGGRILVPSDATEIEIASDGTIYAGTPAERSPIGQLDLVTPQSLTQLEKHGRNLYRAAGPLLPTGNAQVRHRFLEASGTQPVTEMMHMIEASRALETNINMIRFQDEALGRLLQAIPRR
ncbi:MAG TPA: flagellar hook basal-body protein [Planctomycetaceae bacterium]|nr:flagellar hook basal-body protein [Planctomycetaceae bacterium]